MIGVHDISSEVFTLADAQALVHYAQTDPISCICRCGRWHGTTATAPARITPRPTAVESRSTHTISPRSSISSIISSDGTGEISGGKNDPGAILSCFLTIPIYHTGYPLGGNTHSQTGRPGTFLCFACLLGATGLRGMPHDAGLFPDGMGRCIARSGGGDRHFLG